MQATSELQIYNRLELTPKLLILPYDQNSSKAQQIQFLATGGDGSYIWSTTNNQLVSISQTGLANTGLKNLKFAIESSVAKTNYFQEFTSITVALIRNTNIKTKADIYFYPPEKLKIVKYNFETAIGDYVIVHLALYANVNGSLIPYSACDNVQFKIEFTNKQILSEDLQKSPVLQVKNACRQIFLKANTIGTTTFKVSHRFFEKELNDEVVLVTFGPLDIINPVTNQIVLPIGSSRNVFIHQGPRKLFNIEAELINNVLYNKQLVVVEKVVSEFTEDKHIYNILCKQYSEHVVSINIYNELYSDVVDPYISKYDINVLCVKPRFLKLYTVDKMKNGCPLSRQNSQLHVRRANDEIEIEIDILDAHQRKLQNISSLIIDWQFTQSDGKMYTKKVLFSQKSEVELLDGVSVLKRNYLRTSVNETVLNFKIHGIVTQYNRQILDHNGIKPEVPHFAIKQASVYTKKYV